MKTTAFGTTGDDRKPQLDLARVAFALHLFTTHFLLRYAEYMDGTDRLVRSAPYFHFMTISLVGFFIISGWVLTIRYSSALGSRSQVWHFFRRRIFRIWPTYYFVFFCGWFLGIVPGSKMLPAMVFLNNFYLPMGQLGVSWTLAIEEQFYLLFPLLIKLPRAVFAVLIMVQIAALLVLPVSTFGDPYNTSLFVLPFLCGASLGFVQLRRPDLLKFIFTGLLSLSALVVGITTRPLIELVYRPYVMSTVFACTITLGFMLIPTDKFARLRRPLVKLSLITYPFYLIHVAMIHAVLPISGSRTSAFMGSLLATFVGAYLLNMLLFEIPSKSRLVRKFIG